MPERVVVPILWGTRRVRLHLRVRTRPEADATPEIVVEELAIRDQVDGLFSRSLREVPFDAMRTVAIERATFRRTSTEITDAEARTSLSSMTRRRRPRQIRSNLAMA